MSEEYSDEMAAKLDVALERYQPSREEVLASHPRLLAEWKRLTGFAPAKSGFGETVYRLGQKLVCHVMDGMRDLQEITRAFATEPSFATRGGAGGAGERGAEAPQEKVFQKTENGVTGEIALSAGTEPGTAKVQIGLLKGASGSNREHITPFFLTVTGDEDAKLISRKEVSLPLWEAGAIKPGAYTILLESGSGQAVRLGVDIRAN